MAAGLWTSVIVTHAGAAVYQTTLDSPHSLRLLPGTSASEEPSSMPTVQSVALGRDFCILHTVTGDVYTFGAGAYGQLGHGHSVRNLTIPTLVRALSSVRIVAIAAAEFHWLALDSLGRVFACGMNSSGQLGLAHTYTVCVPEHVSALWPHPIVSISTGDAHSAALTATGVLLCFGSNKHGQLGLASFRIRVFSMLPAIVDLPPRKRKGIIDDSIMTDVDRHDTSTEPLSTFIDVACGSAHTVALRDDGVLLCWGKGDNGQLGSRATRTLYQPCAVEDFVPFVSISAGERHSAALTEQGAIYMWGDGTSGQIGDGDISDKFFPVALPPLRFPKQDENTSGEMTDVDPCRKDIPWRFIKVSCGGEHTLAIATDDDTPVYSSREALANRIPLCIVDNMLQSKAGVFRFGSAAVLLATFINPTCRHFAKDKVDYLAAETAHLKFIRVFGNGASDVLGHAAARIRHEAQVAFGLVCEDSTNSVLGDCKVMECGKDVSLVTPNSKFYSDDVHFRSSVANCYESGYIMFLAFMNPIYSEEHRVPELAELAAVLLRCEENAREAFLEMVSHCDEHVLLNRLIHPLQAVLTNELKRCKEVTRNVIYATKALAICYHGVWRASRRKKIRGLSIPRQEFYNETISELVNLGNDLERWSGGLNQISDQGFACNNREDNDGGGTKGMPRHLLELPPLPVAGQAEGPFSFCTYSFLLSESAKFRILEVESHSTMNRETLRSMMTFGSLSIPIGSWGRLSHIRLPSAQVAAHLQYLVLKVRRDHIVSDTFLQVAEYAQRHHRELRKPLKVIFDGEDGVDEGGVGKEFYQVLLERILSPDYGMFEYDEETHYHWFRKDFLEVEHSWTIIGIMFGLAVFNSILLDVQFPPVVYRKLEIGFKNNLLLLGSEDNEKLELVKYHADLNDVKETFPMIGNSLQHLQEYEGDDVEDVFCLSFEVSYKGLFGKMKSVELIENGSSIAVTKENRNKFIELYIEFLMNDSIASAFRNFSLGFSIMLNGPFVHKVSAEELETLVVGEKGLDFSGLRKSTKYEGYTQHSAVIVNLWQVLGEYDMTMKRLFLAFVTGTDRAPIGGLSKLGLIIQRSGGDSNRLPTSHTCFNVFLLPEYGTRAKLRDRLSTAIANSKGFGLR